LLTATIRRPEVWQAVRLLHLHRPVDLGLLLLPALWGLWAAAEGAPAVGQLVPLLLLLAVVRSLLWLLHELAAAYHHRPGRLPRPAALLGALPPAARIPLLLLSGGTLLLLPALGAGVALLLLAAVTLLLLYRYLCRRTFLAEAFLALALALPVPAAVLATGAIPDKSTWLLYTAAALWAAGWRIQYSGLELVRHAREGVRSLAILFGRNDRWLVGVLQLLAIWSLWLGGSQAQWGPFYTLGLFTAVVVAGWQQWHLHAGAGSALEGAYRGNLWFGLAVTCGLVFHFLCQNQGGT